jgi:predicted NUDIX family phosphoesterase
METKQVLVFPRVIFEDAFSLLPWDSVQWQIEEIEKSFSWLDRPVAERSTELVQAIPCAFIRDNNGKFCVLRRVQNDRDDLNRKLSLIVGGHIDESQDKMSFSAAMSSNLKRELEEEVGLVAIEIPCPVGVIIDNSSIVASRHVAFLHGVTAERVSPKAPEEFTTRSKFSGEFMTASDLAERLDDFDPWSKLLIEEYVCPEVVRPQPRQFSFL